MVLVSVLTEVGLVSCDLSCIVSQQFERSFTEYVTFQRHLWMASSQRSLLLSQTCTAPCYCLTEPDDLVVTGQSGVFRQFRVHSLIITVCKQALWPTASLPLRRLYVANRPQITVRPSRLHAA